MEIDIKKHQTSLEIANMIDDFNSVISTQQTLIEHHNLASFYEVDECKHEIIKATEAIEELKEIYKELWN